MEEFMKMDTNRDGQVTKEELNEFFKNEKVRKRLENMAKLLLCAANVGRRDKVQSG
jgi:Ca2+-binding EF-hand superfamily protein